LRKGRRAREWRHLPDTHRAAVQRLHRRVEEAVETIQRLRAENERLRQRVQELESRPAFPEDKAVLALDDDPEAVRERITDFIDVIDDYLEATAPDDGADVETDP